MSKPKKVTNKEEYCKVCKQFVSFVCSYPSLCCYNPIYGDSKTVSELISNRLLARKKKK